MDGRFQNVIESLIVVGAIVVPFFIFALVIKLTMKKDIGTKRYYQVAFWTGVVGFFLLRAILLPPATKAQAEPVKEAVTGLDAPFIAPPKESLESFPGQISTAISTISGEDRTRLDEAMAFLTFASADYVREKDPSKFATWKDNDILAHSLNKMYNYAQDNGNKMTLRKYIQLTDDIKKTNPEVVQRYNAAKAKAN